MDTARGGRGMAACVWWLRVRGEQRGGPKGYRVGMARFSAPQPQKSAATPATAEKGTPAQEA